MISLQTLRILYGRFLALYRWNIINQSKSTSSREISRRIANNKSTLIFMNNFIKEYLRMKIPKTNFLTIEKFNHGIFDFPPEKYPPVYTAARLLQLSSSLFNIKAIYSRHVLNVFNPNEFFFQLHISSSGQIRLQSFKINWPKNVGFLVKKIFDEYLSLMSAVAKKSKDPVTGICHILHNLYQKGQFMYIYEILLSNQRKSSYKLYTKDEYAVIEFPSLFAPNNVFTISITEKGIALVSKTPMISCDSENFPFVQEKKFVSFELTPNRFQVESVLHSIYSSTYQTRLAKVWNLVAQSLSTISWKRHFRAKFDFLTKSIEIFLFDSIVMRIRIENLSGRILVDTFGGIGMRARDFVEAIEGCECQRNEAIKVVFLHALSRIVFNDKVNCAPIYSPAFPGQLIGKCSVRAYRLSYADNCFITFGERHGRLLLSFVTCDGSYVSTPELISVNGVSKFDDAANDRFDYQKTVVRAAQSAKMAALIIQLFKTLNDRGIVARNENGRVHFILDPFECIEFEISEDARWSLKFVKPSFGSNDVLTIAFFGNAINSRFVDWIIHLVWSVSTLMLLLKQSLGIFSLRTTIRDLFVESKTQFTITMTSEICSKLTVSLTDVTKLKSKSNIEVYHCETSKTPHIDFLFSRCIQLKRHLENVLKSGKINFLFGSFLNSSFVPLQYFSDVFTGDVTCRKWCITDLGDESSFFLIFQRDLSINFMLKPAQMFQLIIPSIGKSNVLQIPLEPLPILSNLAKLSHPTWKLHLNQLDEFKTAVERFFDLKEKLVKVGFEKFMSNGKEFYSNLTLGDVSYVNVICYIKSEKIEFEADGIDTDIARNIKILLNDEFDDIETQILSARFVRNILLLDQKFVSFLLTLIMKLIDKTEELKLNWKSIFESSAVMPSERKIILNLYTTHASSCVEISKKEGDLNHEIMGYSKSGNLVRIKNLRELFRWIESMD